MPAFPGTGIRAVLCTASLLLGALGTAAAPAVAGPERPGAPLTCRGKGVDPGASVRHRTETVIDAPPHTIWRLQTEIAHWPLWKGSVDSAERLDHGPFRKGSAFRWTMPVPPNPVTPATRLEITSTVEQLKHGSCIRWTGPATAEGLRIDGIHVWTFTRVPGGVRVATEETHTGPQVEAVPEVATEILRQGLEAWLRDLKTAAEARSRAGLY
ncbi:SRPBCC family protein [Streptomyces qinzhouensis]|uniref:Polyketide cyclase /reductase n=1 Tax=Streptomyces qinzhouensis TaxID=2599401 RepID=A0A5B8JE43_9ACTN|nr:SRPBCC family protein [Streptomyces qinzhouensis]QDY75753.1 polyketide cyclase /reductase [Streptomyces qinzhouensis]